MVVVLGQIDVHPEDMGSAVECARQVAAATTAEPGCLLYAFGIDVARPTRLLLSERWRDRDSLTAHFETPHLLRFRAQLRELRILQRSATSYDVSNEQDLIAGASSRPADSGERR